MSIFKDQRDFMVAAKQTVYGNDTQQAELYTRLIEEEAGEFAEACAVDVFFHDGLAETVKEAVDVIVVAAGYLISAIGPEKAQQAWNLVHEANLAKTGAGMEKREDGKVIQNPHYKAEIKAKLSKALEDLVKV